MRRGVVDTAIALSHHELSISQCSTLLNLLLDESQDVHLNAPTVSRSPLHGLDLTAPRNEANDALILPARLLLVPLTGQLLDRPGRDTRASMVNV